MGRTAGIALPATPFPTDMPRHPGTRIALLLAALAGATAPRAGSAQLADPLTAGARVRVRPAEAPRTAIVGRLVRMDADSLVVAAPGEATVHAFAWPSVARLERSAGTRTAAAAFGRGALRGALVGAGVGLVATSAALVAERRNPCTDCFITAPVAIGVLSVGFTAATTVVGGLVGLRRRETWVSVSPRR